MSTPAQIAANRRNALLSTGPKTPKGKEASSLNAMTFGLSARRLLLPNEDRAQYEKFVLALYHQFAPEGPIETLIADRIIATAWRLRRTVNIEKEIFVHLGRYARPGEESKFVSEGWAMLEDARYGNRAFEKLTRYEAHLHKLLRRDLLDFLNLQRLRHESEESEARSDSSVQSPSLASQALISDASAATATAQSATPDPQSASPTEQSQSA